MKLCFRTCHVSRTKRTPPEAPEPGTSWDEIDESLAPELEKLGKPTKPFRKPFGKL